MGSCNNRVSEYDSDRFFHKEKYSYSNKYNWFYLRFILSLKHHHLKVKTNSTKIKKKKTLGRGGWPATPSPIAMIHRPSAWFTRYGCLRSRQLGHGYPSPLAIDSSTFGGEVFKKKKFRWPSAMRAARFCHLKPIFDRPHCRWSFFLKKIILPSPVANNKGG